MIDIIHLVQTPSELALEVANNMKRKRTAMKISRKALSEKTGVSYASIRRFEETGMIAFTSLVSIAFALDAAEEVKALFTARHYKSMQEFLDENNIKD